MSKKLNKNVSGVRASDVTCALGWTNTLRLARHYSSSSSYCTPTTTTTNQLLIDVRVMSYEGGLLHWKLKQEIGIKHLSRWFGGRNCVDNIAGWCLFSDCQRGNDGATIVAHCPVAAMPKQHSRCRVRCNESEGKTIRSLYKTADVFSSVLQLHYEKIQNWKWWCQRPPRAKCDTIREDDVFCLPFLPKRLQPCLEQQVHNMIHRMGLIECLNFTHASGNSCGITNSRITKIK